MCTRLQLNTISKQMVECYRSVYGKDIADIFLYGSYARGDNDSSSDIDIAAIVKGNRIELQQKLKIVWDVSADIGLENDVVVSMKIESSGEVATILSIGKTILSLYFSKIVLQKSRLSSSINEDFTLYPFVFKKV